MAAQVALYALTAGLSTRFSHDADVQQRPLGLVLTLFAVAFGLHLVSLRLALRSTDEGALSRVILFGAVLFRVILLPSLPIQEIDIYRYLWDGAVVAAGGNPYRYSPQQVLEASRDEHEGAELHWLASLRDESVGGSEALERIHYAELTTAYPPVSQAVFGAAMRLAPREASVFLCVTIMKSLLTLFDLATLGLVFAILRITKRHAGWAVLYGWSPLVLKEYANSGHLDSIAVCLAVGAVWCSLEAISLNSARRASSKWLVTSAVSLGLAVGAKLFPIVLLPVLTVWTQRRAGFPAALAYAASAIIVAAICLSPMLTTEPAATRRPQAGGQKPMESRQVTAPQSGLTQFLTRWEMNDLLFLVVVENLRPNVVDRGRAVQHWLAVVPNGVRIAAAEQLAANWHRPIPVATFLTARVITLSCFGIGSAWLLRRAARIDSDEIWLRAVFLTLAWFWALAPTLNPWYWTWAMPFLPFAGRRVWRYVSLFVFAYYLRFTLLHHADAIGTWIAGYHGETLFHFVVAPVEHGAWMAWLAIETWFCREKSRFN